MKMFLQTPTKLILPSDDDSVRKFLTFHDRSVDYQIRKMNQNLRWKMNNPDSYFERLQELKASTKKCLLYQDADGQPWTYSGLWQDLQKRFGWEYESGVMHGSHDSIPWASQPHAMRYYQEESVNELIKARHAAIELPTASGKSLILENISKRLPKKTLIVTPSAAITDQLYNQYLEAFGAKYVGKYGDGSKQYQKLFTVATAQALTRLTPDSEIYKVLSDASVLCWDESHATPADTFERVCMGLAANIPYRFFLSATQLRTDGSEMVLRGITGPIVYRKTFQELVDEGFISKMVFKTFSVPTYGPANCNDANKETRNQLYCNPNVNKMAADIACKAVTLANRQVIIMVEEFKQFLQLKNYLTVPYEFVHGGASQDIKDVLPQQYWKCDTQKIIDDFNSGKVRLLVGTSAISVGVDLRPVQCLIYLQGESSEVKVRQAIGRGARLVPGKTDCWVVDFKISGSRTMERHYLARKRIYETIGTVEEY